MSISIHPLDWCSSPPLDWCSSPPSGLVQQPTPRTGAAVHPLDWCSSHICIIATYMDKSTCSVWANHHNGMAAQIPASCCSQLAGYC